MDEHLSSRVTSVAAEAFQYRQGCRYWYGVGAVVIKRAQLAYLAVRDGCHFAKSMTRHSGRDQSRDLLGTVSPVRDGGPASRMLKLSGITPVVQPPSPPWNVLPPPFTPPLTGGADLSWTPASGGRLAVPTEAGTLMTLAVLLGFWPETTTIHLSRSGGGYPGRKSSRIRQLTSSCSPMAQKSPRSVVMRRSAPAET